MSKFIMDDETTEKTTYRDFLYDNLEQNNGHWAVTSLGEKKVLVHGTRASGVFSISKDPCRKAAQVLITERLKAIGLLVGVLLAICWVAG
jgi:hypothetical protein